MSRTRVRFLWLAGTAILAVSIIMGTLKFYQYSEYMKWNVSQEEPGK